MQRMKEWKAFMAKIPLQWNGGQESRSLFDLCTGHPAENKFPLSQIFMRWRERIRKVASSVTSPEWCGLPMTSVAFFNANIIISCGVFRVRIGPMGGWLRWAKSAQLDNFAAPLMFTGALFPLVTSQPKPRWQENSMDDRYKQELAFNYTPGYENFSLSKLRALFALPRTCETK